MTSHRCTDGTWQPGKTKDCKACAPKRKPRTVKRMVES